MGEEGETSSSSGAITGTGFNLLPFKKKKKTRKLDKIYETKISRP